MFYLGGYFPPSKVKRPDTNKLHPLFRYDRTLTPVTLADLLPYAVEMRGRYLDLVCEHGQSTELVYEFFDIEA